MPDAPKGAEDTPSGGKPIEVTPPSESAFEKAMRQDEESRIYTGHPAQLKEAGAEKDGEEDDTAGPGKGAKTRQETKGKETTPKGKSPTDENEDLTQGTEKPVTLKGKTHEEEARHRAEAERWGHALANENKDLKTNLENLTARLEALEKGQKPPASAETPPGDGGAKTPGPGPTAAAKERIQKILVQIDELDQFDPEYYSRKADLMAQIPGSAGLDEVAMQAMIAKAVKAQAEKEKNEAASIKAAERLETKANKLASKLGLDMREGIGQDGEGIPINSWDYDTFWDARLRAPRGVPFEDQVKWTVNEVKRLKGVLRAEIERQAGTAEVHHRDTAILERHGEGKPASAGKQVPLMSLSDAFKRTERRI
jgi:hypothetical protein